MHQPMPKHARRERRSRRRIPWIGKLLMLIGFLFVLYELTIHIIIPLLVLLGGSNPGGVS